MHMDQVSISKKHYSTDFRTIFDTAPFVIKMLDKARLVRMSNQLTLESPKSCGFTRLERVPD